MSRRLALLAAASLLSSGLNAVAFADPSPAGLQHRQTHVCGAPAAGSAACDAIRDDLVDSNGRVNPDKGKPQPPPTTSPRGLHPTDIETAYGFASAGSSTPNGPLVAIVDAYDDPTAEADLGVYRAQFGLPVCTTGNGCFRKVNQTGGVSYPNVNGGWAQEISLDLDMVSAACPNCRILLVEASSASFTNLAAAVNYAATQSVSAISNSYGGSDFSQSQIAGYDHPGIAITASTGDSGYGVESPASFKTVIAVGGTSLTKNSNGTFSEKAWSGAGSGCSTLNAKPSWQTGTQCSGKALADVSAVADPNTGVSVYDSTSYQGLSGWLVFGGTSASSPIIASAYAMGGNLSGYPAQYTWGHTSGLHDVSGGSNGSCSPSLWCNAVAGWDGPTGLGTPSGLSAF